VTFDGELEEAFSPQSVTLTLDDEIDVSRGDVIVRPGNVPHLEQRFDAMVVWMHDEQMVPGKNYVFKMGAKNVTGTIGTLRYGVDVNTLHRQEAPTLKLNEIGRCNVSLSEPVCFDAYRRNRLTGSFIVVDRITNATLAAGMVADRTTGDQRHDHWDDEPGAESLHTELSNVTQGERAARFGQAPATILLTGLTGSGKTTIAYALERRLFDMGRAATVLDGQNMRQGISRDLGFSADDRSENLRRSAEVAKLINEAGLICIAAFVAPNEQVRQRAAQVVGEDRFLVIHIDAPLEICRERDEDGQYDKADSGDIAGFPGVSAPYEVPETPDLTLATHEASVVECVDQIVKLLEERGFAS
jgi:bifunctional enzyme CysN/CysC